MLVAFLAIVAASPTVRRTTTSIDRRALGLFAIAGVFTALAQLTNFFALEIGAAVLVIPLFNTFPLLVLVLTYLIARELPKSPAVILAVVSIVVGSVLIEML
nr:EamA family transporter [Natrinema gelatinilyticum]